MRPQDRGENGNKASPPPQGTNGLDGELTTITSIIDLPLDRYVIIIFQREGGRWCGQQSRVGAVVIGSFMAMAWWLGVEVGLACFRCGQ